MIYLLINVYIVKRCILQYYSVFMLYEDILSNKIKKCHFKEINAYFLNLHFIFTIYVILSIIEYLL